MASPRLAQIAAPLALLGALVSLVPGCVPAGAPPVRKTAARPAAGRPQGPEFVRCLFDAEDLKRQKLDAGAAFAVGSGGRLLLQGPGNIHDGRTWEAVATAPLKAPLRFAAAPGDALYVVTGRDFGTLAGGTFRKVTELPAEGFSVAAGPEGAGGAKGAEGAEGAAYLYGPAPGEKTVVYLVTRPGAADAKIRRLLFVEGSIDALAPVGPGFVFARGGRLFRAAPVRDGKVGAMLIAELGAAERIRSLAFDKARGMLFISTDSETLFLRGKTLAPILGFGGELALGGERSEKLYVYQPSEGRAFEVELPGLFAELARRAAASSR